MPAPSLDQIPADQSTPTPPRRRRRALALLTAGTLVVLATGVGVSVALATRPSPTAAPPAAAAPDTTAQADTAPADAAANAPAAPSAKADKAEQPAEPATDVTAPQPAALADGKHDAYIRKVDTGRDSVVVDVVQVFHDEDAVKAAIEDGVKPADAKYKTVHVRNENPRLRTLPLAGDLRVNLLGCEEGPSLSREALLAKLAENARAGSYFYTLTVHHGSVRQIDEKIAGNAC